MFLRQKVPWTTQPPAGTPIDWSNPLAQSLSLVVVGTTPSVNIAKKQLGTMSGVIPSVSRIGRVWTANSTTGDGIDFGSNRAITTNQFSIAALCAPALTPNAVTLFSQRYGAGSIEQTDLLIGRYGLATSDQRGVELYYRNTAGNNYYADNSGTWDGVPDGNWHIYGASRDASGALSIWRDGINITSGSITPTGTFVSSNQKTRLGNLADYSVDGTYAYPAQTALTLVWDNKSLDLGEWAELVRNPWQVFRP